jgi:hypothetical protein
MIGLQGISSSKTCMGESLLKKSLPVVLAHRKANAASQCANGETGRLNSLQAAPVEESQCR